MARLAILIWLSLSPTLLAVKTQDTSSVTESRIINRMARTIIPLGPPSKPSNCDSIKVVEDYNTHLRSTISVEESMGRQKRFLGIILGSFSILAGYYLAKSAYEYFTRGTQDTISILEDQGGLNSLTGQALRDINTRLKNLETRVINLEEGVQVLSDRVSQLECTGEFLIGALTSPSPAYCKNLLLRLASRSLSGIHLPNSVLPCLPEEVVKSPITPFVVSKDPEGALFMMIGYADSTSPGPAVIRMLEVEHNNQSTNSLLVMRRPFILIHDHYASPESCDCSEVQGGQILCRSHESVCVGTKPISKCIIHGDCYAYDLTAGDTIDWKEIEFNPQRFVVDTKLRPDANDTLEAILKERDRQEGKFRENLEVLRTTSLERESLFSQIKRYIVYGAVTLIVILVGYFAVKCLLSLKYDASRSRRTQAAI